MLSTASALYRRHRYPAEIIVHAVWLYFRFNLSFRDVEELMTAAFRSATRPSAAGAPSSAPPSLCSYADDERDLAINGISTK